MQCTLTFYLVITHGRSEKGEFSLKDAIYL